MFTYVFLLCLTFWSVDARNDYAGYIHPYTYTDWGSPCAVEWCPPGTYAYGFRLKVQGGQGSSTDDTALNGIKLYCRGHDGAHSMNITSDVSFWGEWRATHRCPDHYFLQGAWARSEKSQGGGDDTAANNYNFVCESSTNSGAAHTLHGDGMDWGWWGVPVGCPPGSFICGIRTQVEPPQGGGDDTALNDAMFFCCRA